MQSRGPGQVWAAICPYLVAVTFAKSSIITSVTFVCLSLFVHLVIDRADNCINLCEIKFHQGEISLSKSDVQSLERKRQVFLEQTKTKKALFVTMVTCFGVKENGKYHQVVDNQITMDALFEN